MSKESKEKNEGAACCDPKEFKGMFQMMNKCFANQRGAGDCSSMMEFMTKGGCCSPSPEENTKESH